MDELEHERVFAKVKGDAGQYQVWAIDWLGMRVQVYRAGVYEWLDISKVKIGYKLKGAK